MAVEIVFSLNRSIANPLMVTLNSILQNCQSPEQIRFNIAVPDGEVAYFEQLIQQHFPQSIFCYRLRGFTPKPFLKTYLDKKFKERRIERRVSRYMQYARLFIKDIFPDLNRVIYLDVDVLVLGDIQTLFEHKITFDEQTYLAAVPQNFPAIGYFKRFWLMWSEIRRFKQSFNSGVLLTELKYWSYDTYKKLHYYFELDAKYNHCLFELGDETIFNLIFKENYYPLPKSWNCCGYGNHPWFTRWMQQNLSTINILHWSGGHRKPWQSPQVIFSSLWSSYLPPSVSAPTL